MDDCPPPMLVGKYGLISGREDVAAEEEDALLVVVDEPGIGTAGLVIGPPIVAPSGESVLPMPLTPRR